MKTKPAPNRPSPERIAEVRDMFGAILCGEIDLGRPKGKREKQIAKEMNNEFAMIHDILSWVLADGHDEHFTDNIEFMEDSIREAGYEQCQIGVE